MRTPRSATPTRRSDPGLHAHAHKYVGGAQWQHEQSTRSVHKELGTRKTVRAARDADLLSRAGLGRGRLTRRHEPRDPLVPSELMTITMCL